VIRNATEALSEWASDEIADGRRPPEPRSYVELLRSGNHGLGQGGLVATIPLILLTGKVTRANISIDAGLLSSMDEAATRLGVTRSAFLAAAVREKLQTII
jgi:hypothetical protein